MKTNSDLKASTQRYYLWGTLLIWSGVLIWVPFIILQTAGQHPSFLWFLPFHLVGVVGGSRLRAFARKEMGIVPPKRNLLQIAGSVLIVLGILAWAPYFYLKVFTQISVEVMNFLPFHLIGVLGGILLLTVNYLISRKDLDKEAR
jgi:hypothetical protein